MPKQFGGDKPERRGSDEQSIRATATAPRQTSGPPQTHFAKPAQATLNAPLAVAATTASAEFSLTSASTPEVLHFEPGVPSSHSQTQTSATATSPLARMDIARGVATQVQAAAKSLSDRPVDLSLNPEELGKVKLSITTTNGSVVLQVLAERTETLDLMRRHADVLAEELNDLGFDSIDLSFGQGQSGNLDDTGEDHAGETSRDRTDVLGAGDEIDDPAIHTNDTTRLSIALNGSGGLDIRV